MELAFGYIGVGATVLGSDIHLWTACRLVAQDFMQMVEDVFTARHLLKTSFFIPPKKRCQCIPGNSARKKLVNTSVGSLAASFRLVRVDD